MIKFGRKKWDWTSWRSLALIGAAAGTAIGVLATIKPATGFTPTGTGVIVPLYMAPDQVYWKGVADLKRQYPKVPVVAVVNQNSGFLVADSCPHPGSAKSQAFVDGINMLTSSGVKVIAYVATGYNSRCYSPFAQANMNQYKSWYAGPTGLFLDEMANVSGSESYYSALNAAAHAIGYDLVVGNPGTDTTSGYAGTVDNVMFYETYGYPSDSYFQSHTYAPKSKWSFVAYGVQSLDVGFVQRAAKYVQYMYVTNDGSASQAPGYQFTPPYLPQLVSTLASI